MTRSVQAFLPVSGDANALARAFASNPQRWLPEPRREGVDTWRIRVHAAGFSRAVVVTVGDVWQAGSTCWRTVRWDPLLEDGQPGTIDRVLPSFDGELGLGRLRPGACTLVLDGRYAPPGGAVGMALDTVALHRVARWTAERLVADVAAGVSAEALLDDEKAPIG